MEAKDGARMDPSEEVPFMTVDETDFSAMTLGERMRHLEVEGFVVLPRVLDTELIGKLKDELAEAEMTHKSYSTQQTFSVTQPQWISRTVGELIAHPPTIEFLTALTGPDLVFTRGFFQRTLPGSPGISMHTDGQPHGSSLFGYEGSCPKLLRVLYYLDDLTPTRAPFRLIPRSHLSFHADASPYVRYKYHPEEITLCLPTGSAIVLAALCFHGTHGNRDAQPRELIQFGYRAAWAGPVRPMEEWDPEHVAKAPTVAKPYLQSLNTSGAQFEQEHKPEGMRTEADSINPSRWE
jgi:hypothetical protein